MERPPVDGLLLDISGVLYQGAAPLPGAPEAMQRLRASGLPMRFATNTSRSSRAALAEKLRRMDYPVAAEEIFTAPCAAVQAIRQRGLRPLTLVHPELAPDLAGLPGGPPDAVLIGDAGEHFDYRGLNQAFRLLMTGAPLLALARNRYFREADGLSLDVGPFVAALEYASGVTAEVFGKPAPAFFREAAEAMGVAPDRLLMVGDDVESDVVGALDAGLQAALVRTGKYSPEDETRLAGRAPVLADLPALVDGLLGPQATA